MAYCVSIVVTVVAFVVIHFGWGVLRLTLPPGGDSYAPLKVLLPPSPVLSDVLQGALSSSEFEEQHVHCEDVLVGCSTLRDGGELRKGAEHGDGAPFKFSSPSAVRESQPVTVGGDVAGSRSFRGLGVGLLLCGVVSVVFGVRLRRLQNRIQRVNAWLLQFAAAARATERQKLHSNELNGLRSLYTRADEMHARLESLLH